MSVVYSTGFDLAASTTDMGLDAWYQYGGGGGATWTVQPGQGRYGGTSARIIRGNGTGNNPLGWARLVGTINTQCYVGVAMRASSSGANHILTFVDTSTSQFSLILQSDGSLLVARGSSTTIGSTAAGVVKFGQYHYFEVGFVIGSGTSGSVTVTYDMSPVITLTGVNNQQSANASWNTIILGSVNTVNQTPLVNWDYDDLYICNNAGSQNNNFLGDISVVGILPTGAGTNSGFSRTGGTASGNYTAVNESPNNGDTSYVASGTVSAEDTYQYPGLYSNTTNIFAVIAKYMARKDDTGSRHITGRYRESGSEADFAATDMNLVATYSTYTQVQETNPVTTAAWLPVDITAGEFGFRVSS